MNELGQYIDKDLMIAAAQNMRDRSDEIDAKRVAVYNPMTFRSAFGGSGGIVDYPTSYKTHGVYAEGFLWFDDTIFMEGGVTFRGDSEAPWAEELHRKWNDCILHRAAEAFDVQQELDRLKRCIMQYLEDVGQVDLENAGLLQAATGR